MAVLTIILLNQQAISNKVQEWSTKKQVSTNLEKGEKFSAVSSVSGFELKIGNEEYLSQFIAKYKLDTNPFISKPSPTNQPQGPPESFVFELTSQEQRGYAIFSQENNQPLIYGGVGADPEGKGVHIKIYLNPKLILARENDTDLSYRVTYFGLLGLLSGTNPEVLTSAEKKMQLVTEETRQFSSNEVISLPFIITKK